MKLIPEQKARHLANVRARRCRYLTRSFAARSSSSRSWTCCCLLGLLITMPGFDLLENFPCETLVPCDTLVRESNVWRLELERLEPRLRSEGWDDAVLPRLTSASEAPPLPPTLVGPSEDGSDDSRFSGFGSSRRGFFCARWPAGGNDPRVVVVTRLSKTCSASSPTHSAHSDPNVARWREATRS